MFYQNSSVSYLVKNGIKGPCKDCPGGPVIKTSPSNAGGARSIPGQGAMIPLASQSKTPTHKTEAILQQTQ